MYKLKALTKFPKLVCGFSTIKDGNMSFLYGQKADVIQNRKNFISNLGVNPKNCVALTVLHGTKIKRVGFSDSGKGIFDFKTSIKADGLITDKKGLFLFLLIADCLPIIFFCKEKGVISLIHAGWKGVGKKIIEKAINKFKKYFDCDPRNLIAVIGPAIHKDSYIFSKVNQSNRKEWKPFINKTKGGKFSVDLIGYSITQMRKTGLLSRNIFISPIDTAKSNNFFSFSRDKKYLQKQGRFACLVGIKD